MQILVRKVGWFFSLVILLLGYGISAQSAYAQTVKARTQVQKSGPPPISAFSRFSRAWVAHSAILIFAPNGQAVFAERTYTWCDAGKASPCDSINASGQIRSGYQEKMQFSRVSDSVAYGTIIASNFRPVGLAVTVSLLANDTLLYTANADKTLLCGPDAPVGTCGA